MLNTWLNTGQVPQPAAALEPQRGIKGTQQGSRRAHDEQQHGTASERLLSPARRRLSPELDERMALEGSGQRHPARALLKCTVHGHPPLSPLEAAGARER